MPQMMPINWMFFFFLFISIFVIFIIMNYYIYNFKMNNKYIMKNNIKKYMNQNWKW